MAGADDRERLVLVHHHPGRIRVRASIFRTDAIEVRDAVARVISALEGEPGVHATSHNAATGSLLIQYEPGHAEPNRIIARIADVAELAPPLDDAIDRRRERPPALVAVEVVRELNELTAEVTGHRTDLRGLVPAALVGLAAYSFRYSKESRLPRWDNLLWWSYSLFTQLHHREINETDRARANADEFAKRKS